MRTNTIYRYLSCYMFVFLIVLTACSTGAAPTKSNVVVKPTAKATAVPSQGVGASGCKPASAIAQSAGGGPEETQGTGRGMAVWALLFNDLKASSDQKIVWRLTGNGNPQFTTVGPEGQHARLVFGPTAHSGSSWDRPGQEWGLGFNFQTKGCWDLHVTRGNTIGDVWLVIK